MFVLLVTKFLFFVLGAIIGSFLNVVILRWNTGQSIFGPRERSRCFSCGKQLVWWELVPIVSFCILRGRCSVCKSRISWQYPAVETVTGVLFVLLAARFLFSATHFSVVAFLYSVAIASLLVVITFYDLKHKIIPNVFVYSFIVLALVHIFFLTGSWMVPPLATLFSFDVLAGPIFYAAFALLWLVSRGRWIGFGDAKLVFGIGLLLGFARGLSALVLSFWIGAAVGSMFLVLRVLAQKNIVPLARLPLSLRNLTMKSEIPFAPFLILGTALAFFCGIDIFGISNFF